MIIFPLEQKLVYQSAKGVSGCEAFDLELIAPSYEQREYSRKLKQIVHNALKVSAREDDIYRAKMIASMGFDASKFSDSIEEVRAQGEPVKTNLQKKKDLDEDVDWMRNVLFSGIPDYGFSAAIEEFVENAKFLVKVDDGVFLQSALVRQIGETEMDKLFCYYCLNFIHPSLV